MLIKVHNKIVNASHWIMLSLPSSWHEQGQEGGRKKESAFTISEICSKTDEDAMTAPVRSNLFLICQKM